jgi:Protein of unknown function (DUF3634)
LHALATLSLLGLIGWGLWHACQPRSIFVVRIENGRPRAVRGVVTRAFLGAVAESCQHHGVSRGAIMGRAHGRQIALEFKGEIPAACRQQLRNVWVNSGWSAPKGKTRRGDGPGLA